MPRYPLLLASLLLLGPVTAGAVGTRDAAALNAMKTFAAGKTGVVVWQTRRTGPLRIFACNLDGSNLRQVSASVSGYDQIAPMISPDGKWIIYYQTATLTESTYYNDHVGAMVLIKSSDTKGATAKTLVSETRTFFECRFARWIDNNTIAYVGKDHNGYTYSISQNKSTKIFDYPLATFGAIPNKALTYAIDGGNRVFQLSAGTAVQKNDFDGCEGNMSTDNKWAYRVKATVHDFTRMKLGTWGEEVFFQNHDSALPSAQGYIYFPQISPCQKYLALGASPDTHNHFTSDYDIFVVPVDPVTFKKTGSAVKYSFDAALDSYPDIWVGGPAPACTTAADCNDANACTTDTCSGGACQHSAISGCCTTSAQCDDANACTTDTCSANKCQHSAISGCCTTAAQCDDTNVCTKDTCSANKCQHSAVSGCCTASSQCDDSDPCTSDLCTTNACKHNAISGCCTAAAQCDDTNVCTKDTCSANKCQHSAVSGCCSSKSDCDDTNPCTTDTCDTVSGKCSNKALSGCCAFDTDCDDGNPCTLNTCVSNACQSGAVPGCCAKDGDCDDSNACTTDSCDTTSGACSYKALGGCCTLDTDCDDGDACTLDTCDLSTNTCHTAPICSDAGVDSSTADAGVDSATPDAPAGSTGGGAATLEGGCAMGRRGTASPLGLLLILGLLLWIRAAGPREPRT